MKSGQNNAAAHLGTMRQRRIKRIKRQRAIEVGKPVDVSLKPMTLNAVQRKDLSGLPQHARNDQKHGVATRSRVSVLVSLGFHAVAVFIAAFFVVRTAQVEDEAIGVDFLQKMLEKRDPPIRKTVVRPKPLPTEPLKPIVLPVPKVPVRSVTPDSESALGDATVGGLVDPGPSADANINTDGLNRLDRLGPIKQPTVDTEDPTEMFRQQFEDSGLGDIGDPPDLENTPEPDLTGGQAFVPKKVTRLPEWRRRVEPKYPSAARRAQKEGRVVLVFSIDANGKAQDIKVKEDKTGFGLARAAVNALEASRFTAAKPGEERGNIRYSMAYQFKLED